MAPLSSLLRLSSLLLSTASVRALSEMAGVPMPQKILVTGANSGIGLALCKQLVNEYGCHVFLGARDAKRGEEAVQAVKNSSKNSEAMVELIYLDVANSDSVERAAIALQENNITLDAIVNNAGRGFAHNASPEEILNVNLFGTKRVVDAFLPVLRSDGYGRIVNVGSGGGGGYVSDQKLEQQKFLCSHDISWEEIENYATDGLESCRRGGYGISKALVASYTQLLAREHKGKYLAYCLSPGYIKTAMTAGGSAKLEPEDGTKSLRHCLFKATPDQSGWFFGSDCKRSPLNLMRNPGQPVFTGVYPWEESNKSEETADVKSSVS